MAPSRECMIHHHRMIAEANRKSYDPIRARHTGDRLSSRPNLPANPMQTFQSQNCQSTPLRRRCVCVCFLCSIPFSLPLPPIENWATDNRECNRWHSVLACLVGGEVWNLAANEMAPGGEMRVLSENGVEARHNRSDKKQPQTAQTRPWLTWRERAGSSLERPSKNNNNNLLVSILSFISLPLVACQLVS